MAYHSRVPAIFILFYFFSMCFSQLLQHAELCFYQLYPSIQHMKHSSTYRNIYCAFHLLRKLRIQLELNHPDFQIMGTLMCGPL